MSKKVLALLSLLMIVSVLKAGVANELLKGLEALAPLKVLQDSFNDEPIPHCAKQSTPSQYYPPTCLECMEGYMSFTYVAQYYDLEFVTECRVPEPEHCSEKSTGMGTKTAKGVCQNCFAGFNLYCSTVEGNKDCICVASA